MNDYPELITDRLDGRVALVTGGSRGIGRAACIALAARGASVAVHYRSRAEDAEQVVAIIRDHGGMAASFHADLEDPAAPDALVQAVVAQFGQVDILVNNAGEMTRSAVEAMDDAMWEQSINLNLTATFRCCRACIPGMKARGWGRIINVTSQAAITGSINHAHYAAAKSGMIGFTHSLAKELGPTGITVNLVAPGRIVTDLIREHIPKRQEEWLKQTPLARLGTPEEVAGSIAFLASEQASYITGATIHVNGGLLMS